MNIFNKLFAQFEGWFDKSEPVKEEETPGTIEAEQPVTPVDTAPGGEAVPEPTGALSTDEGVLSDLERLLAEEGIDLNAAVDAPPAEAQGMSAKEWLIASSDDELIRKGVRLDE